MEVDIIATLYAISAFFKYRLMADCKIPNAYRTLIHYTGIMEFTLLITRQNDKRKKNSQNKYLLSINRLKHLPNSPQYLFASVCLFFFSLIYV